ncbi:MAG: thiamine phosphate synthase [Thermodesulfovibrionales bacterium]|nr:thiamine phosphate synthase [Thermodesulfovibrionales bacterium]
MFPKLYLITDRKLFFTENAFLYSIERALKAGVTAIQLREKDLPIRDYLRLAYQIKSITEYYRAKLFINDRVDVALSVGASGVHLAQTSIPPHAVRKIVKKNMLIGVSTHSLDEAKIAQTESADFITFGPIFKTPSKLKYGDPVGLNSLKEVRQFITIPILAIGGIDLTNINEVLSAGANGVAVIRSILSAENIEDTVSKFIYRLEKNDDKNSVC